MMKSIILFTGFLLMIAISVGCSDGGADGGGGNFDRSGNSPIYEATLPDTTLYLVKKSDQFLIYRKQSHFDCYVFIQFSIVSQNGQTYTIEDTDGNLIDFTREQNGDVYALNGTSLVFTRNGQIESDIKPKCGDPQAQGEISVAIAFQQLPDTIRRNADDFYEWNVTFDMDNNMQPSPGDVVFTVNSFYGKDPSAQQTSIEEIGADLFVYYDTGARTSIGDISVVVEGNTLILSAPKSLYTSLESITNQTQINVSASYSDGLTYHSDYLPGSDQFTAIMDTSDIADEVNDQSGSATFVDIVNVSVAID